MARKGDGSSVEMTGPVVGAAAAYTYHFWYRDPAAPGTALTSQPLVFRGPGPSEFGFSWHHTSASFKQAAFHQNSGAGYSNTSILSALVADKWYPIAVTFDGNVVKIYLNGLLENQTTVGSIKADTYTGHLFANSGASFASGALAEPAFWPVALTPGEILALARGAIPERVRPEAQLMHIPFRDDGRELAKSGVYPLQGAVPASHPDAVRYAPLLGSKL